MGPLLILWAPHPALRAHRLDFPLCFFISPSQLPSEEDGKVLAHFTDAETDSERSKLIHQPWGCGRDLASSPSVQQGSPRSATPRGARGHTASDAGKGGVGEPQMPYTRVASLGWQHAGPAGRGQLLAQAGCSVLVAAGMIHSRCRGRGPRPPWFMSAQAKPLDE